MAKKTALVTGGAGFIGSHLCDKLILEGFKVICLDNLITGEAKNISQLVKNRNFIFVKHDATKYIKVSGKLDYVLHLASPASPVDYLNFPVETLKVGSLGTLYALELARKKKAVFLLTSTSEVYGDPLVHPQNEQYWGHVNPVGPRSCYDESKRFAEAMTMAYLRRHKLDTRIVRIFNTYGPRMRIKDGRVVPNFIYQALNHKPVTVYGDGKQTRSFCYVSDMVEGLWRMMHSKVNQPVNLGNPGEFTIIRLAELILKITGVKQKMVFRPLPVDDPRQRRPDISRARKLLGWRPKIKLEEGLRLTLAWFRAQGKSA